MEVAFAALRLASGCALASNPYRSAIFFLYGGGEVSSLRTVDFDILRGYAFFVGAHAAPTPRRPPKRDFALGVSAFYGGWLARLVWRNSAASSAFYGERGTGIAPRLPHPGEVSPGTPSLLSSASSQLRFAVCKRFEWMRFGVR